MRRISLLAALLAVAACAQPSQQPPATTPETVQAHKPKIVSAQLLGQSDTWLLEKMGEPHFKRADRVANIWQYKNAACVLNVFLYGTEAQPTATPQTTHVLHFDARDGQGKTTDRDVCLSVLQD